MGSEADNYEYDIAVTFAGEDRTFVNQVVDEVKSFGYSVFYDEDEQVTLWGEELTEYFPDIYERRARFAVMFISADYAAKPWTRLERQSVLLRAMNQTKPYLLPVRIDQTVLPGVRSTISYLEAKKLGADGIASAIRTKLGPPNPDSSKRFNGLAPRTEHEVSILIGERPDGWEYLLFSYLLVTEIAAHETQYLDYRVGFAVPSGYVPDDEIPSMIRRERAATLSNVRNFSTLFSEESQARAFGEPGEPGDLATITHLAQRIGAVYNEFMDWGKRLRGYETDSDAAHEVLKALSHYSDQPVQRLHDFPLEYREQMDQVSDRLKRDEPIKISFDVSLAISTETTLRFEHSAEEFIQHIKHS